METMIDLMKKTLADTFVMYLKVHSFHWNVEGPNFPQYHKFFGKLYEELHDSIDPIAEEIRALNAYAPGSLTRYLELAEVQDQQNILAPVAMCFEILKDNEIVLADLNVAFDVASELKLQGLADFLSTRIDVHNKHAWMLRSISK
jgi:starvation-inducible DNA-binding protein